MDSSSNYEVDHARLEHGRWCPEQERTVGEGDICVSYSGDLIALQGRARKSFRFQGDLWCCVGLVGGEPVVAKAYKLALLSRFNGQAQTYSEKTGDAEAARNDPNGFYHGIKVAHRGESHILTGPPIILIPGKVMQQSLFVMPVT